MSADSMRKTRAARTAAGLTTDGTPRTPQRTVDDIDEVAVALALGGHRVELNQGEKRAVAARTMHRPRRHVADILRCSIPNVDRLRRLVKETHQ